MLVSPHPTPPPAKLWEITDLAEPPIVASFENFPTALIRHVTSVSISGLHASFTMRALGSGTETQLRGAMPHLHAQNTPAIVGFDCSQDCKTVAREVAKNPEKGAALSLPRPFGMITS